MTVVRPEGALGSTQASCPLQLALYADVDMNIIDGSAVWLPSMASVLCQHPGISVDILLKSPIDRDLLTAPLRHLPGARVIDAFGERLLPNLSNSLSPFQVHSILEQFDEERPYDAVVVRGLRVARELSKQPSFEGRTWYYLTDFPQRPSDLTSADRSSLEQVARHSQYLLCQTEDIRSYLEGWIPAARGKAVLMPPMVPTPDRKRPPDGARRPLRLFYAGKFAPLWNTLEMTSLPRRLADRGVEAELTVVGDKFHRVPDDPHYRANMRRALEETPGIDWRGGCSREQTLGHLADADIALSWRHAELDDSLELSTKVLEACALGVPVVINPTPMHQDLFGKDYPLLADTLERLEQKIAAVTADEQLYSSCVERCQRLAEPYSFEGVYRRLEPFLDRLKRPALRPGQPPLRLLVAGHDLKFFTRILEHFERTSDVEVRVDHWAALAEHDEARSEALLSWADTIFCEWCGPVAIWYSQRCSKDQRLFIRFHRFEKDARYPRKVDIERVTRMICVSSHYRDLVIERFRWPAEKVQVIDNWVDVAMLDRPKVPEARYHLGLIGTAPCRKRLDLGLDVLEMLREQDPRFQLFIKSKPPWEYWWIWDRPAERTYYRRAFTRIQNSTLLRGAVTFDDFGPDVGAWLRKIGWLLSTSDDESFHLGPAEGMASGAIPLFRDWPGVRTIYDDRWVHAGPRKMAEKVLATLQTDSYDQEAAVGEAFVRERFDLAVVMDHWDRLFRGQIPASSQTPSTREVGLAKSP